VLAYIEALSGLSQAVLRGVALSLGLEADYFAAGYTARSCQTPRKTIIPNGVGACPGLPVVPWPGRRDV
jgi:hypothetical protein